ncbi:hypothetical protein Tco_0941671 [Tanacetum coccineum]|uniref:Uncharacterized protein n=1 Tax=Tanacetum coccineum TaxID=301880 RepID=A0ABQ5DU47_9ASTR
MLPNWKANSERLKRIGTYIRIVTTELSRQKTASQISYKVSRYLVGSGKLQSAAAGQAAIIRMQSPPFIFFISIVLVPVLMSQWVEKNGLVTRILEHLHPDNIDTARNEIFQFLELRGKKEAESIVPRYDSTLDVALSRTIWTILVKYAECLSRSKNIEDVREVLLVIEKIDPWLMALDSDMVGRTELVIHLLEPTSYDPTMLQVESYSLSTSPI